MTTASPPPDNRDVSLGGIAHKLLLLAASSRAPNRTHSTTGLYRQFEWHTASHEPKILKKIRVLVATMLAEGEMVCTLYDPDFSKRFPKS